MAAMSLTFKGANYTSQGWTFALYQKQPKEVGLKNMAWKVLKLSEPQPNPTTGSIPWKLNFKVTIPEQVSGDVYIGGLSIDAKDGYNYEAYMQEGYIQLKELGKGEAGYINVKNSTHKEQDLGISLSGSLLAMQKNVVGGVSTQFKITPTYYLGLFTHLEQGSFVSSDVAVGPVEIHFPPGKTIVSVDAVIKDGTDVLSDPKYQ